MLKRKVSPAKQRPSMSRVISKMSNLSQRNVHQGMPKTRFSLNDRSISSPRLKSFPAERIRRIDRSPSQNFSGNFETQSRQVIMSGQGDTLQNDQYQQFSQSNAMPPNQNISSMSEQQLSRNVYPIENHQNQSELVIPSSQMENPSFERPHHRPFVPNVINPNTTIRDNSPRKLVVSRINESPLNPSDQMTRSSENEIVQIQQRDPWKIENDSIQQINRERVDDFPSFKPSNLKSNLHESVPENQKIPQRSSMTDRNVSNVNQMVDGNFVNWQRQIDPRLRSNVPHYCNNNFQTDGPKRRFMEGNFGMTSPQDIAINHIKNYQRSMQFGNCACMSHHSNHWIQDNQPRSIEMAMPPIKANPPINYNHQMNNMGMGMTNQHENFQQATHNQYYNQQNEITKETSKQSSNNVKLDNEKKEDKRKPLRFSQAMIRDQEMLVTTMRQQGINEEIMRRQFEALLAEQRKQLLYLEQLKNPSTDDNNNVQQRRRVQRRISRIEEDGKPEWMLHITPPRIPYSVVEKMRADRQIDSRVMEQQNANNVENNSQSQPQSGKNVMYVPVPQENYQNPWQTNEPNYWNHQPQYSYVCNNANVTKENQIYDSHAIMSNQYQQRYPGYPVYHQQQLQNNYEHQTPQKMIQNHENSHENNQTYEKQVIKDKQIEPSSLLKLRIYKEVIKRQKQNNGLQDPETIKEALEALKNPANRKGLEYLEKLNKKHEKPISLNGAQDPHENRLNPNETCHNINQATPKIPSANGLENSRNPNNPTPRKNLLQRKIEEFQFAEYPRQRPNVSPPESYSLMAEKENGTVANNLKIQHENHHNESHYGMTNNQIQSCPINIQTRSDNGFQFPAQIHPEIGYNDKKSLATRTVSMPIAFNDNSQSRYYAQQMQQYYGNRDRIRYQINNENRQAQESMPHPGFYTDGNVNNNQQQEIYYPRKNDVIHETRMIGGVKYLARKPEYSQNSIPSQRYPANQATNFNPMIACQ